MVRSSVFVKEASRSITEMVGQTLACSVGC